MEYHASDDNSLQNQEIAVYLLGFRSWENFKIVRRRTVHSQDQMPYERIHNKRSRQEKRCFISLVDFNLVRTGRELYSWKALTFFSWWQIFFMCQKYQIYREMDDTSWKWAQNIKLLWNVQPLWYVRKKYKFSLLFVNVFGLELI